MRVLHIASDSARGGAARAALRLHMGLLDNGVLSSLLVSRKSGQYPGVHQIKKNRTWAVRASKFKRFLDLELSRLRYLTGRDPNLEAFSDDRTMYLCDLPNQMKGFDVIVLHYFAGFLDWHSVFTSLSKSTARIVFVLHDMNAFTGGCHYDMNCGRFALNCGKCPQLPRPSERDLSRQIWQRKEKALQRMSPSNISVIAPSRWIGEQARMSSLFSSFPIDVIPYGIETDVFRPFDKQAVRNILGIPNNSLVVCAGAQDLDNLRKGIDLLVRAISILPCKDNMVVLSIGNGRCPDIDGVPVIHTGSIGNDRLLANVLSCADMLVIPSRQEVSGQIALEAMACGVPVIGFAQGGIPDYVRPGETGLLASPADSNSLSAAIGQLADDGTLRAELGARCREVAVMEYSIDEQVARYAELFRRIVQD